MLTADSIKNMYHTPWYHSQDMSKSYIKPCAVESIEWCDEELIIAGYIIETLKAFSGPNIDKKCIKRLKSRVRFLKTHRKEKNPELIKLNVLIDAKELYKDSKELLYKLERKYKSEGGRDEIYEAIEMGSVALFKIRRKIHVVKKQIIKKQATKLTEGKTD